GKSAPGPEKLGISYPGVPGLFRNRLADSIQLMQKTIWNNQIALKNKETLLRKRAECAKNGFNSL
ncbi:MAG: hypothetical protein ACLUBW_11320, partial [Sutterella wadsworthensis]